MKGILLGKDYKDVSKPKSDTVEKSQAKHLKSSSKLNTFTNDDGKDSKSTSS